MGFPGRGGRVGPGLTEIETPINNHLWFHIRHIKSSN